MKVRETFPNKFDEYKRGALRRLQRERKELARRREKAWELARHAASLLKEKYGATKAVVFGSLTRESGFTRWSDVDIAAWGLKPEDTLKALGEVMDLSSEIELNLVDVAACPPELLRRIESEGVEI